MKESKLTDSAVILWEYSNAPSVFQEIAKENTTDPVWLAFVKKEITQKSVELVKTFAIEHIEVISLYLGDKLIVSCSGKKEKEKKEPVNKIFPKDNVPIGI